METEEHKQPQLVYITYLEDGLPKNGTKLYLEEDPDEKKPAASNRLIEVPSLNNLNHDFDIYGETGSDAKHIEDFFKGENKKNSEEDDYTSMDEEKEGKQADLLKSKITRYHHNIPRKKSENVKALVMKEMGLNYLEKTFS